MKRAFQTLFFATAITSSFIVAARADSVPASMWNDSVLCAGEFEFCTPPLAKSFPGTTSASFTSTPPQPAGTASVSATESVSSSPSLSATASASGAATGTAGISFTYYIELTGPSGPVQMTVDTQGSGGSDSQAFVAIADTTTSIQVYVAQTHMGVTYVIDNRNYLEFDVLSNSFSRSDTVNLTEGVIYSVTMDVAVTANSSFPTQTASVDPYFIYPEGYSLDISEGVGNSPSPTPLPAALPLLASGLGAFALTGRRRRRKAVAPNSP